MKKNLCKRLLALFMALSLCLGLCCTPAFATDTGIGGTDSGSAGSSNTDSDSAASDSTDSSSTDGNTSSDNTGSDSAASDNTDSGSTGSDSAGSDSTDSDSTDSDNTDSGSTGSDSAGSDSTDSDSTDSDNIDSDSIDSDSTDNDNTDNDNTDNDNTDNDNTDSSQDRPNKAPMQAPAPAGESGSNGPEETTSESSAPSAKDDYIYVYLNAEKVDPKEPPKVNAEDPGSNKHVVDAFKNASAKLDEQNKAIDKANSEYKAALDELKELTQVDKPDEVPDPFTEQEPQRPASFSESAPEKPDILKGPAPGTSPEKGESRADYEARVEAYNQAAEAYNQAVSGYNSAVAQYKKDFEAYLAQAQAYNTKLDEYRNKVNTYNSAVEAYNKYVSDYTTLAEKANTLGKNYQSAVDAYNALVKGEYQNALDAINQYNDMVADYNSAAAGMNSSYTDGHVKDQYDPSTLENIETTDEYNAAIKTLNDQAGQINKDQESSKQPLGYETDLQQDASLNEANPSNFGVGENWLTIGRVDISDQEFSTPDEAVKDLGISKGGTTVYTWEAAWTDGALTWTGNPNSSVAGAAGILADATIKAIGESIKKMMESGNDRYDYKGSGNQGQAGKVDENGHLATNHSVLAHTYKWELKLSDGATDYGTINKDVAANKDGKINWTWHLDGYVFMQPMVMLLEKVTGPDETADVKTSSVTEVSKLDNANSIHNIPAYLLLSQMPELSTIEGTIDTVTPTPDVPTPPTPPTPPTGGGGNNGGGGTPPVDPQPPVDIPEEEPPLVDVPEEEPPLVDIPEEEPPLVDVPEEEPPLVDVPEVDPPLVDVPDSDVPQASRPTKPAKPTKPARPAISQTTAEVDIVDEEVPLADVPKTGDNTSLWCAIALAAVASITGVKLSEKKKAK